MKGRREDALDVLWEESGETRRKGKEKADWLFVTCGLFDRELNVDVRNWVAVGKR